MKKGLAMLLALTLMLGTLSACGGTTDLEAADKEPAQNEENQEAEGTAAAKIGVVLTTSGLGDNNFNDMVYAGLRRPRRIWASRLITQSPLLPTSTPP